MRLALIAILLAVVVTVGIHAFSPNRRAKMVLLVVCSRRTLFPSSCSCMSIAVHDGLRLNSFP
jgi:hypothetical protein